MTDIIVGEIVRVVISYSGPAASIAQNVFYWECKVANCAEATALEEVTDWFEAEWLDNWSNLTGDQCVAFLLEMDIVNGDGTVDRNIGDSDIETTGIGSKDILPAAVAGYMQGDTERSNSTGRKFVPFLAEVNQEDGLWTSGTTAFLADMLANLFETIVINLLADFVPGVISRVTSSFQEYQGSGYTTNVPAYQRRRKPNVGS